jgi:pimeloyl-ACP methyl ester carboxylesterase
MSELKSIAEPEVRLEPDEPRPSGVKLKLLLHRWVANDEPYDAGGRKPVLLLHGASACHKTFTVPDGGLAKWLFDKGLDPWMLDWRGSHLVISHKANKALLSSHGRAFNFNDAARYDIAAAINVIREHRGTSHIGVLGHCMGSGTLAEAVACDHLPAGSVDCVVLQALGLHYVTPIAGLMKSQERLLERLAGTDVGEKPFVAVDPRVGDDKGNLKVPWPGDLEDVYINWPGRTFHPDGQRIGEALRKTDHMCNRVAFMYGMPYFHENLIETIHGTGKIEPVLEEQFGAIPLQMFIHATRNIRARRATSFKNPNGDDDGSSQRRDGLDGKGDEFLSDAARARFHALRKVTLITGEHNQLWQREGIDMTYDWLKSGKQAGARIQKRIFPTYGHQDLLWGKDVTSPDPEIGVFEVIREALT